MEATETGVEGSAYGVLVGGKERGLSVEDLLLGAPAIGPRPRDWSSEHHVSHDVRWVGEEDRPSGVPGLFAGRVFEPRGGNELNAAAVKRGPKPLVVLMFSMSRDLELY